MAQLKSFLSHMRWCAVNLFIYASNRRYRKGGSSRTVHFDIQENLFHRYLTIFMHFLEIEGYTIRIRSRGGLLGSWATKDLFRQIKGAHLYLSDASIPVGERLFSDRPLDRPHVLLDADYFCDGPVDGSVYVLPMPMVDTFYLDRTHDRPARDPSESRERGAFFFGNMDPDHYDRPELSEAFGCLSRLAFLQALRSNIPNLVKEPIELKDAHVESGRFIVLMGRHQRYIRPAELRPVLERFDFFLAPCGVVMPLCHNLVEAMSVGCIPILQHAHLLSPPLRHMEDCLCFSSSADLIDLLQRLRAMDASDIERMRRNVLSYYEKHLTPAAVVGELDRIGAALTRVKMNAEWPSTRILLERKTRMRQAVA